MPSCRADCGNPVFAALAHLEKVLARGFVKGQGLVEYGTTACIVSNLSRHLLLSDRQSARVRDRRSASTSSCFFLIRSQKLHSTHLTQGSVLSMKPAVFENPWISCTWQWITQAEKAKYTLPATLPCLSRSSMGTPRVASSRSSMYTCRVRSTSFSPSASSLSVSLSLTTTCYLVRQDASHNGTPHAQRSCPWAGATLIDTVSLSFWKRKTSSNLALPPALFFTWVFWVDFPIVMLCVVCAYG